jgi:uncharacterized membrane-anchored protein YhcB (DUF1043 family)
MLKELMKALGKSDAPAAEVKPVTTDMTIKLDVSAVQAELDKVKAEFEAFQATTTELVTQAEAVITDLTAKLGEATAALAAVEAEKAALAAEAEAKRLASRKEKVEAAIGTEKAAGLLAATENLDDAAFEAVVSALAGSVDAEASTSLFKEVGVTAEADAAKVVEESAEMKILKQKYQPK